MIAGFFYYLFIKPLSLLPLPVLYILSDFLHFVLFRIVKYRVKVVNENLKRAFPNKTEEERYQIAKKFYAHLCDLIVESIRFFSMSEAESIKRFRVINPEMLEPLFAAKKNAIIVSAHYNNWEITALAFKPQIKHKVVAFYTQLSNAFFEKKFSESRMKYGCVMISTKKVRDFYMQKQEMPCVTLYASDQSPSNLKNAYWTTFLNQDTAVATGAERYAKEFNLPVYFGKIRKVKRGYYTAEIELICEDPTNTATNEISEKFTRSIEELILSDPQYWLWTHKRWKHKREK